jgi:hypothetical protein
VNESKWTIPVGMCRWCFRPEHPSGTMCPKHPDLAVFTGDPGEDGDEEPPKEFACTECGGDAFLGYSEGWNGKVTKGERLCTYCFRKRGGVRIL